MMFDRVIEILSDFAVFDRDSINEQTRLVADMGLSSLDVVNIVVAFEDEFDIEIPDELIPTFTTVGSIIDYLTEHTE